MPTAEFIKHKDTQHNVVSLSNHLRVFVLYSCPVCRRYTIHKPRIDSEGMCFMDHKRMGLYQMEIDGSEHLIGYQAADSCFVPGVYPAENIQITRTVIRVK